MRVLLIDIDTLRPDHMGCYGYNRETTPCMDAVAKEGTVFKNYYTPNAPCLPSRASLCTGMYGIHTGIVGHGGTAGDMRIQGTTRGFQDVISMNNLFRVFRKAGFYTASISTFADRHSSWWFNSGFNEMFNLGKYGQETADEVTEIATKWIGEHADKDNWFLHYHIWDPHTPYRSPEEFGNPFENVPLSDNWITQEIFDKHCKHVGPHNPNEINGLSDTPIKNRPRYKTKLESLADVKDFMDQYDCGIKFADDNIQKMITLLKDKGIYEDTAIIITSDHGENMGELAIYGEHGTADEACCHIPMIIKWPNMAQNHVDNGLHTNVDLAPTMADLLGVAHSNNWDGKSYAKVLTDKEDVGQESICINQCAHICQRSVRFGDYIYIRTVHAGLHLFGDEMLFNVKDDPHEENDLSKQCPELCAKGAKYILDWEYDMMKSSKYDVDPMWTVMREGGPLHARGHRDTYAQRLRETGREKEAEQLLEKYKDYK